MVGPVPLSQGEGPAQAPARHQPWHPGIRVSPSWSFSHVGCAGASSRQQVPHPDTAGVVGSRDGGTGVVRSPWACPFPQEHPVQVGAPSSPPPGCESSTSVIQSGEIRPRGGSNLKFHFQPPLETSPRARRAEEKRQKNARSNPGCGYYPRESCVMWESTSILQMRPQGARGVQLLRLKTSRRMESPE